MKDVTVLSSAFMGSSKQSLFLLNFPLLNAVSFGEKVFVFRKGELHKMIFISGNELKSSSSFQSMKTDRKNIFPRAIKT